MEQLEKICVETIEGIDDEYEARVCGSYRRGATDSGDIDILLTHPGFTSESKKNVCYFLRAVCIIYFKNALCISNL